MWLFSAIAAMLGAIISGLVWWLRRESRKQKSDEIARENAKTVQEATNEIINVNEENRSLSRDSTDSDNIISL